MKIITDQQGRILCYPIGRYPPAYLIPTEEISDSLEKKDANFSFYAFILFFIMVSIITFGSYALYEASLGGNDSPEIRKFLENYFNIASFKDKNSELLFTLFCTLNIIYFFLDHMRVKWLTRHFLKISLSNSYKQLALSISWPRVIFGLIFFLFSFAFFSINSFDIIPKTSIFTVRIELIIFIILLIGGIQEFILLCYKIRQSRKKTP